MCKVSPNKFCFVCGLYIFNKQSKRNLTKKILFLYEKYFGARAKNLNKPWTPNSICISCAVRLHEFGKSKKKDLPFSRPALWRSQGNHINDCYFCQTKVQGGKFKKIIYPDVTSVTKTEPNSLQYPKRESPVVKNEPRRPEDIFDPDWDIENCCSLRSEKLQLINQLQLNDLCRDLNLSKEKSELLASRLKEHGFLSSETKVSYYRNRSQNFHKYFSKTAEFCYCNNVSQLFVAFGEKHDSTEWRLFIDASKYSLKVVLLHNGNLKPSIPIAHSTHAKESYSSIKKVLDLINYNDYKWKICCDLKVVAILTGLQGGYTKNSCFRCLWDSRADKNHFTQRVWPPRENHQIGQCNVVQEQLVDPNNVIFPPLHIKLGLMKNFVKALAKNPENAGVAYLRSKFPKISSEKIKAGLFTGPQIKKLFLDANFKKHLNDMEAKAWSSFEDVVKGFLGNEKSHNYCQLVTQMLDSFHAIGK